MPSVFENTSGKKRTSKAQRYAGDRGKSAWEQDMRAGEKQRYTELHIHVPRLREKGAQFRGTKWKSLKWGYEVGWEGETKG